MGFSNKMCMLSNTPIAEGSKVKLFFLVAAGVLANVSQVFMSHAYRLAPAGQISPVSYMAIIFAGLWGFLLWHELPDVYSMIGFGFILLAIVLCSPLRRSKKGF